jgi:hypothetical protein
LNAKRKLSKVVEQRRTDYLPGPMVASPSSESEGSQITVPPRFKNKLKQSNAGMLSKNYKIYEQLFLLYMI